MGRLRNCYRWPRVEYVRSRNLHVVHGGYEWSNDIKTRGIVCPHLSLDGPSLVIQSGREDDPPRIDKSKIQNETYANEPPF